MSDRNEVPLRCRCRAPTLAFGRSSTVAVSITGVVSLFICSGKQREPAFVIWISEFSFESFRLIQFSKFSKGNLLEIKRKL
ncbi:hypothetical protein KFK09_013447 [Dendrobium nobile]|uniref:Uncharacterized protein n=1 Tax=Dendrobium nobile TaxID=94219 RepID=A0A8T3B8V3_DENNO|nr:hypothetical protein KFK09_013447 [Dendrobium nobile]